MLLASVEQPDFSFLDPNQPNSVNVLALLSKTTFKTIDIFKLERYEIVNCILPIQKRISA
ncbi:MAG: hypothetical protein ACK56F_06075 [bacterium]